MIAHPNGNDRGIIVQNLRSFYEYFNFHYQNKPQSVSVSSLDASFPRLVRYGLTYLSENECLAEAGMSLSETEKVITKLLKRFQPSEVGGFRINGGLSDVEGRALNVCANNARGYPSVVFKSSEMLVDLELLLLKINALEHNQLSKFRCCENSLCLFVVCLMHRLTIDVFPKAKAPLVLHAGAMTDKIDVCVTLGFQGRHPPIRLTTPVFSTGLPVADFAPNVPRVDGRWQVPIEVASDGRIVAL